MSFTILSLIFSISFESLTAFSYFALSRSCFIPAVSASQNVGTLHRGEAYDLYFEPNYIPLKIKAKKTVTTVADFSPFKHPECHDRELIEYFNKYFWKNISRADHIITISNFVRNEAINDYGFPPEKVTTIHLGHDSAVFKRIPVEKCLDVKRRYSLPDKFILCVGSIEPRKNLLRLIHAYQRLPINLRDEHKLVLTGFRGWENKEIMALIKALEGDVIYTGYVEEKDLAALYNLARLFVFPSIYEGFGLPPLEAMACGCPVIAANSSSLPEVCGDAAVYIDPHDTENMATKIEEVLLDEKLLKELRIKGQDRAKLFEWDESARKHLELFDAIVNSSL